MMQGDAAFMAQFLNGLVTLCEVGALAGAAAAIKSRNKVRIVGPLRLLGRAIDYTRAVGYVTEIAIHKAWETALDRWPEALYRARSER